jgi:hypothetical protein
MAVHHSGGLHQLPYTLCRCGAGERQRGGRRGGWGRRGGGPCGGSRRGSGTPLSAHRPRAPPPPPSHPTPDVIFLPAMFAIQTDLQTTPTHVAATLAAPMFTLGVSALVWGPACDAFGRRPTFLLAALGLLGLSIGSALSPNIMCERPGGGGLGERVGLLLAAHQLGAARRVPGLLPPGTCWCAPNPPSSATHTPRPPTPPNPTRSPHHLPRARGRRGGGAAGRGQRLPGRRLRARRARQVDGLRLGARAHR